MSDAAATPRPNFLGRLADEALGIAPTVQPRRISQYEPVQPAWFANEPLPPPLSATEEWTSPDATSRTRSPEAEPWHDDHSPFTHAVDRTEPRHTEPVAVNRDNLSLQEPVRRAGAIVEPAPVAVPRRAVARLPKIEIIEKTPVRRRQIDEPVTTLHALPLAEPIADQAPAQIRAESEPHLAAPRAPQKRKREAEAIAALVPQPVGHDVLAPPTHQPERRTNVRHNDAAAPPASTPVVNVTIGRVEVRVPQAVETRSAERRGQRPLSLDDYLKRRTGQ